MTERAAVPAQALELRVRGGLAPHPPLSCIHVLGHTHSNIIVYLQLIGLDVSAAVRVILPPGLKQKGDGKWTRKRSHVQLFTTKTSFFKSTQDRFVFSDKV